MRYALRHTLTPCSGLSYPLDSIARLSNGLYASRLRRPAFFFEIIHAVKCTAPTSPTLRKMDKSCANLMWGFFLTWKGLHKGKTAVARMTPATKRHNPALGITCLEPGVSVSLQPWYDLTCPDSVPNYLINYYYYNTNR
jgi:hypothetical protein